MVFCAALQPSLQGFFPSRTVQRSGPSSPLPGASHMSDHPRTTEPPVEDGVVVPFPGPPLETFEDDLPPAKPKIRWLRLIALLTGLGLLAGVSTVFGMMMAVASDLPELDVLDVADRPSELYDASGKVKLGTLTGNERRIVVKSEQIAPVMKHAIVSIEDRRFFTNSGVDIRGIGRALYQDVIAQKAVQGGSTITQQLVKNRLDAQNDRTLFQKLREAAIAFHMTEKWDKQRILTNYLNTIYFGNGAYGIESAARTYFGYQYDKCGEKGFRTCASQLEPHEAALLAGVIASPSGYDPVANPQAAKERRDLVLNRMLGQGYITRLQHDRSVAEPIPARVDIRPPSEESEYPYFTTWVRQQVVDRMGPGASFEGGLRVTTTIDARMQKAANAAVQQMTGNFGAPAAALVAIDNRNGEVVAMVGGDDEKFNERPFNLATQGQRQPGSAFKPFTLIEALRQKKARADSTYSSKKKAFCVTRSKSGKCREWFEVNNYEDNYAGVTTLANATAQSDNSVYAELGINTGVKKIARLSQRMGIRTKVSTNPAITLGGLEQGVTVLDMAHAYQTIARDGKLIYGTLSPDADDDDVVPGPVGIREIRKCKESRTRDQRCERETAETLEGEKARNRTRTKKVFKYDVAQQAKGMLAGVVKFGTAKAATLGPKVPVFGKTGTTEDYGDAWFVGFTKQYTVAVWVGYPDEVKPMKPPTFGYQGDPVAGGTWPTVIWRSFMGSAMEIYKSRLPKKEREKLEGPSGPTGPATPGTTAPAPTTQAPEGEGTGGQAAPTTPKPKPKPQQEAPAPEPEPAQPNPTVAPEQQQPEAPPEGGGTAPPT
jgi:penicillin-binding protein 1A